MFNFRLINTPDGNQIIDRNLKTPYNALTPSQMVEYTEMDNEELERKFGNCSVNNCYTLHNGFLYRCPYNAGVSILQAIPGNLRDALSISQLDSGMVEDALESFMKMKSSQICKFCKGRPKAVVDIEAARQIKYKHHYKKYDSIEG